MRTVLQGNIHRDAQVIRPAPVSPALLANLIDITKIPELKSRAVEGLQGRGVAGLDAAAARLIAGELTYIPAHDQKTGTESRQQHAVLVRAGDANRLERLGHGVPAATV